MANDHGNADNYTRPHDKARWGFGGTADKIELAQNTVGETPEQGVPGEGKARTKPKAARDNGGGAGSGSGTDGEGEGDAKGPTVVELKKQLDEKGIEYATNAKKADLQALLADQA
jgi:hypothetical protein